MIDVPKDPNATLPSSLEIYYGDDWVEDSDIPPELGGFDDNVTDEIEN